LWKTQGAIAEPWRADLRFGAVRDGPAVYLSLTADRPWAGRLVFDRPRHRLLMHLPFDYARINQFPEWFTTRAAARYEVHVGAEPARELSGAQLAKGLELELKAGEALGVVVRER
jgi:hypothetical protein